MNSYPSHIESGNSPGAVPKDDTFFIMNSLGKDHIQEDIFAILEDRHDAPWYEMDTGMPEYTENRVREILSIDTEEHRALYHKLLETGVAEGVWCSVEQVLAQEMNREMKQLRTRMRTLFEEQEDMVNNWNEETMTASILAENLDALTVHMYAELDSFHVMEAFSVDAKHWLELVIQRGFDRLLDTLEEYAQGTIQDGGRKVRESFQKDMPYDLWLQSYCQTGKRLNRKVSDQVYTQTRSNKEPLKALRKICERQKSTLSEIRDTYGAGANMRIKQENRFIVETQIVPALSKKFPGSPKELETIFQFLHSTHMDHWDQREEGEEYDSSHLGGKYRSQSIGVGEHMGVVASRVPSMMKEFSELLWTHMRTLKKKKWGGEQVEQLAAWAYLLFLDIHPFMGGNGRTARSIYQYVIETLGSRNDYGEKYPGIPVAADGDEEMGINGQVSDSIEFARSTTISQYIAGFQDTTPWTREELWEHWNSIETKIEFSTFWIEQEMNRFHDIEYTLGHSRVEKVLQAIRENSYPGVVTPEMGQFFVQIMYTLQHYSNEDVPDVEKAQERIIAEVMNILGRWSHEKQRHIGMLLCEDDEATWEIIDIVLFPTGDTIFLLNNFLDHASSK